MATPNTKVKVLGLKKVLSSIRKAIILELRSKEMRQGVADIVIESIRSNRIPVTSDITLAFREFYEQFNKTHSDYRRQSINMTFTGQLLDDLRKNTKLKTSKSEFTYIFEQSDKNHKGYKFRSGSKLIKSGKNKGKATKGKAGTTKKIAFSKISEYLYDKGYDYLNIDEQTLTKAERFIQNRLTIKLKSFLRSQ